MKRAKPRVGALLGDPTGIGPEVVAKFLSQNKLQEHAELLVIGDYWSLEQGQKAAKVELSTSVVKNFSEGQFSTENVLFLDLALLSPGEVAMGEVSAKAGKATLETLSYALELAQAGRLDALVYGPLNKQALSLGGSLFKDELQFFAHKLDWQGPRGELNVLDKLWTSRVTSHVGLKQVSELITEEKVFAAILLAHQTLRQFGLDKPRLAVAALNPHGGEGGLFGSEEIEVITPAIMRAQAEGIEAEGPFPADTIFLRANKGKCDAVISMYHDQGQIAMKLMGFERGVTVSGGLPIAITTPAHGTAFDIAGKGVANPEAFHQAFLIACRLASPVKA
jgi:4-hydroxythreonine-4-phosphate dehydrogenase